MPRGENMQGSGVVRDARTDAGSTASGAPEYPVRDYIGDMAGDLARMARWDGDERLARALDHVARLAAERPG